ncbi:hypothetical protein [Prochlorococcus marinus]|uniref:hypothetical protein n=1 Tax=Prochlorococcus marinus TaxID=1219 RepID=UPI0022B2FFB1|nr:hypothetical protein [Prochlorococcus marinus]
MITDRYDHDIDQFMYFGSRLLHGELIWTNEFDDKSPILQYIFSLPAALKSTSIFVVITLIISLLASYIGYLMLRDIVRNSNLELNRKAENSIIYFGIILYLTLLVCIYGSLHHINAISSSLCLITISLAYLNRGKKNKLILNFSAIAAAISISIRPYYLLNIIIIPLWLHVRERGFITNKKEINIINKNLLYAKKQIIWISIISFYILLFNTMPYLITGQFTDFIFGIKLNSVDYINHNILLRQYINLGRNPILYPMLIGMILLPIIRIIFGNIHKIRFTKKDIQLLRLKKIDIDILFFGIINPILLEIMFYRKHFFGHYFTLFSPYITVSMVLFLALITKLDKIIYNYQIFKIIIKNIFIILLITCLITNQSIPGALSEIFDKKISSKSYKVKLVKDFINQEKLKSENVGFLAPEDNYLHWKLDESRHRFPQKAIFRNISEGKMDKVINENKNLDYKFLLPTRIKLCETLNKYSPQYIITRNNDYSFNCLIQKNSKYKLLSTKKLNKNNIFIFKSIYQ